MQNYNPNKIESRWQEYWQKEGFNKAHDESKKPKYYCLDMFPYPSGEGLHVGHVESYTATDIVSRYMRLNGYNVLHPQGWDAFGLPAENYAIKTGVKPQETTKKAIENFKRQIKSLGFSYDWSREINTSDPEYYKWTQWLFLQLYKNGLAYQKMAPVNWCESCKTVLAREQVIDGKCERCGKQVIQKELKQWFFRITDYAEKLLSDLKNLDWPEKIKKMQEHWIGKSEGALIKFPISNFQFPVEVFTTRPDTIFGATYLVIAPEHDLIQKIESKIKNYEEIKKYINRTKKKTELERTDLEKTKTGVEIEGIKAVNPATKKEIPIYIADYVLTTYGTGAIMAVPAHDKRDWEFAILHNIQKIFVIKPKNISDFKLKYEIKDTGESSMSGDVLTYMPESETIEQAFKKRVEEINNGDSNHPYTGNGKLINSGKFNGMDSKKVTGKIIKFVDGKKSTQYKLRDWLISRQRYWGAPIPIIYCEKCGTVPVPEKDLPVKLPSDIDFRPTGESPLARSKSFQNIKCPKCQSPARRESDTMDTFVDSSWYFLRYADTKNDQEFASKEKINKWLPVDLYIGGAEHAVMHLLYARFFTKVLKKLGYLKFDEPFLKLRNQGTILAPDGRKMSKSLGNVINPDEVIDKYSADVLRLYEMFMGPLEDEKPWDTKGIKGIERFLDKVRKCSLQAISMIKDKNWQEFYNNSDSDDDINNLLNNTIIKVTEDIKLLKFNTAISSIMIFTNLLNSTKEGEEGKLQSRNICEEDLKKYLIVLSPFAPHIAEELWHKLGNKNSIFLEKWPSFKKVIIDEKIIPIQINGKVRANIKANVKTSEKDIVDVAIKENNIKKYIEGKNIKKVIYIPGKILNIVV